MILKKGLAVLAMAFFFEAFLSPAFSNGRFFSDWLPEKSQSAKAARHYVLDVLRENRTGLGSLEELKLAEVILMESVAHKIDPLFVLALIENESTFYNWTRSFRGAVGLMQILPTTGEELAGELNVAWKGEETLLDPYTNVRMGVHYLSRLKSRYKDLDTTLSAYNFGPGRMDTMMKEGNEPEAEYAHRVLESYRKFKEKAEFY
ncbi:MAG: hypothetical protein A2Z79_02475 [Deltaproteobacteria bacterium GWA2_55_82]|nr:MAG: hypothetical protein A2Z79_02475 [Deltaproteobacteria bacterium GWA2_55_82]OGQ62680.1 MAG: hypothetical protein A3I81_09295 [Deltaproteobacteria bacterium RIFCSPLOWO2_02_FULL_55_12]